MMVRQLLMPLRSAWDAGLHFREMTKHGFGKDLGFRVVGLGCKVRGLMVFMELE